MINKKNIDLLVKLNMSKANMVICMYIVSNLKIEKQKYKQGQTLRKGWLSTISTIFYGPQDVSEGQS